MPRRCTTSARSGTPDHILLKPGRLTDEEMAIMKQHAAIGHDILHGSESPILQAAAVIALSHHEVRRQRLSRRAGRRSDPAVRAHRGARRCNRALTSSRPYKKAWELDRAVDFIRQQSGAHFDPACVAAFFLGLG